MVSAPTQKVRSWHDVARLLGGTVGGRQPMQFVTLLSQSGRATGILTCPRFFAFHIVRPGIDRRESR